MSKPSPRIDALPAQLRQALRAIDPAALMLRDRRAVQRRVHDLLRRGSVAAAERLLEKARASASLAASRAALNFDLALPRELPISHQADVIAEALDKHQVVVVCGATGSGKTTQLPKLCLAARRGVYGTIGHTQPRRLAARAVADRVASELGTALGEGVGYRVRFVDKTGPQCRVKLMTDGILLQELGSDPWLNQYDTLILDEAHERSLNIDFLLGVLKRTLKKRADLKLIVTSATIDPQRFARYFDDAPVIEVSGRGYPIEMRYTGDDDAPLAQRVCAAVQSLMDEPAGEGDALVFLPGERDIREADKALRGAGLARRLDVLPLYARLSAARQAKVFQPGARRRVVLTTNVAETSLTVPRVRYVIDSGLARISRYSHRSKMQRLPVEPVARANLDQRAGRCGRLGPGVCVRLFSEEDADQRPTFEAPEIQRSNLAGVILRMAHLRLGRIEDFDFMDPPDARLVRDGYSVLRELGALDDDDQITPLGLRMAALPLEPRLARALLAAERFDCLDEALIVVSALAVPDVRERSDAQDEPFIDRRSDWTTHLNLWRAIHAHGTAAARRAWCKDAGVSWPRLLEWREVHRQLLRECRERRLRLNAQPADTAALHRALLTGFVSHIGQNSGGRQYRGARGREFSIFPGSPVAAAPPPWIVATQLIETSRVFGHGVAAVKPGWILEAADHLVRREPFDAQWSAAQGRATARQRAVVFGLSIELRERVPLAPLDPPGARALMITHLLVAPPADTRGGAAALPFSRHNRATIDLANSWEARLRRTVVDEPALFRFFDQRVPRDVVDARSLVAWHKSLDNAARAELELGLADVGLDPLPDEALFPTTLQVGRNALPLKYEFAPATQNDGVTLTVPVALLPQLADGQVEWLVPGWLPEKVERLLRSLPKARRRQLAPIAEAAGRFLDESLGEGGALPSISLYRSLAAFASRLVGEPVDASHFAAAQLPEYLDARIEVVDQDGAVLTESRSLAPLLARYGDAGEAIEVPTPQWQQEGLEDWSFDDLPQVIESRQGGLVVEGRPALVDHGTTVALRVFADPAHADQSHAAGVARLVLLTLRDKYRYVCRQLPGARSLALRYAALGDAQDLFDDIAMGAVQAIGGEDLIAVRSRAAFEALVSKAKPALIPAAQALGGLADAILDGRQRVLTALDERLTLAHPEVAQDLRRQIDHLVPARFVGVTPAAWLAEVPRFLKAAERRLERLASQGRENPEHRASVAAWWDRFEALDDERQARLSAFRWLLEEYRVSLFSQPIKTSRPVSAKRLRALWDQAHLD